MGAYALTPPRTPRIIGYLVYDLGIALHACISAEMRGDGVWVLIIIINFFLVLIQLTENS